MDEITLAEVPETRVLGSTEIGTYALIPELLVKVYQYIGQNHVAIAGPPVFVCHETSPQEVKKANESGNAVVEVAWPIMGEASETKGIRLYTLPGGKMVRAVHHGPYEECEPAYMAVFTWIREHNLEICGWVREVYLNDPSTVKPEEILMEILVPVR